MIKQNNLELLWRTRLTAHKNIPRVRVTMHEPMLKDHISENIDESFSYNFCIEPHFLYLLLFCYLGPFDKVHDNYAVGAVVCIEFGDDEVRVALEQFPSHLGIGDLSLKI